MYISVYLHILVCAYICIVYAYNISTLRRQEMEVENKSGLSQHIFYFHLDIRLVLSSAGVPFVVFLTKKSEDR